VRPLSAVGRHQRKERGRISLTVDDAAALNLGSWCSHVGRATQRCPKRVAEGL
jgi:hypothetical protein